MKAEISHENTPWSPHVVGLCDYTKTTECVDSKAALLALGWKDKLIGIVYGIDDMQALCKANSSEYPSFSEKMDKLLHN